MQIDLQFSKRYLEIRSLSKITCQIYFDKSAWQGNEI